MGMICSVVFIGKSANGYGCCGVGMGDSRCGKHTSIVALVASILKLVAVIALAVVLVSKLVTHELSRVSA